MPLKDYVAAISVGIVGGEILLDLDYAEDSSAEVDMNVVMTGSGKLVEVQATAEGRPFGLDELNRMIDVARPAIQKLLAKTGVRLQDIDLFELNEAFAAQSLGVLAELPGIDPSKVNLRGGAIAIGHPIGASGTRILVTLLHLLQDQDKKLGLAALCVGGGQGVAMLVERL